MSIELLGCEGIGGGVAKFSYLNVFREFSTFNGGFTSKDLLNLKLRAYGSIADSVFGENQSAGNESRRGVYFLSKAEFCKKHRNGHVLRFSNTKGIY